MIILMMSGEKEVCNNITQGSQSINLIGDYVMQFFSARKNDVFM